MIGTLRKGFIDEGGRSETKTDQALRLRNLRGNFLSQSENLHPCDPEPQKLRRACEMENIARAGYNNMNTYEYQRQTYVSNYLDGLNRGETCEKMKLQSPPHLINVQYPIEENEHDASLHLKMPTENSFNSNRYITTRPTVSPSWTSTEYPRHGFAYCDSSRAFVERAAESVSPSCMFSSPRALYQHYINHPGSQMQWIHDLSQGRRITEFAQPFSLDNSLLRPLFLQPSLIQSAKMNFYKHRLTNSLDYLCALLLEYQVEI